ncbi:nuclear transport factor 2 family protein [Nocardia sp. ET3-3]|uniref:Nuclear transport factor 2 family protein n=1 Tax=Nocardia terrae TaxID=2675851 RepID=A0A7K1V4G5_9NOCA|nr:nuclear transport factor 2 family protein [Nocardia terrae]MVU81514.1 nuclear transport factor 2 family protein [Nocardia terrae]
MRNESDLHEYLTVYPHQMAFGDDEPGVLVDRWFTPDIDFRNDGYRFDRRALVAHARPARKNAESVRVEVHRALLSNDTFAAHYTLYATLRTTGPTATEICMIGRLAADGRIAEVDQLTRSVPVEGE